jgi:hypothetical protein
MSGSKPSGVRKCPAAAPPQLYCDSNREAANAQHSCLSVIGSADRGALH